VDLSTGVVFAIFSLMAVLNINSMKTEV